MPDSSQPLLRHFDSVLVRVSPEILTKLKTGDVEPVVILGVQELEDGTHEMTLMTPNIVAERDRYREALEWIRHQCGTATVDDAVRVMNDAHDAAREALDG